MLVQSITQIPHLLHGVASFYPLKRKSGLETSLKVICFKKIRKFWFIFACSSMKTFCGFFLETNKTRQIGWPVGKLDGIWSLKVQHFNSSLMVVWFHHIKIMWLATVAIIKKRQCGFTALSFCNFSVSSSKRLKISIFFMVTCLFLFITSAMMRNRNILIFLKTCLPLSFCGWMSVISLFTY